MLPADAATRSLHLSRRERSARDCAPGEGLLRVREARSPSPLTLSPRGRGSPPELGARAYIMTAAAEPPAHCRSGDASAQAARAASARRLGCARAYLRSRRQISIYAGPRLHAAGCAHRTLHCAARSSRLCARRASAGQRASLRHPRAARCPGAPSGAAARHRHHRYADRTGGVTRLGTSSGCGACAFICSPDAGRPGYVRGVGLDVFEVFRPVMRELWLGDADLLRLAPDGGTGRDPARDLARDASDRRPYAAHSG